MATNEEPMELQLRPVPQPELKDLVSLPVASEWRDLGLQLGVPEDQLDTIQANHRHSFNHSQDCLTAMFSWWLKNSREPTYERLAQALVAIGKRDVAEKICQKHGIPIEKLLPKPQHQTPKGRGLGVVGISIAIAVAATLVVFCLPAITPGARSLNSMNESVQQSPFKARGYSDTLPYLLGPVLGREIETKEIVQLLDFHNFSVRIVSIVGAPGFGKSTLATHVGHKMQELGVDILYINMYNVLNMDSLTISGMQSSTTMEGLLQIGTLVILNNCDDHLQDHKKDEFQYVLKRILQHSLHIKVLMTSRKVTLFLDGFQIYRIGALATDDAIDLLRINNPWLDHARAAEICELLGNMPLALKIIAALLGLEQTTCDVNCIIHGLKKTPIEVTSPPELPSYENLNTTITMSYQLLHPDHQKCGRYLSNLNGSFDENAARTVLPPNYSFTNSGTADYASQCLDVLVKHSLLEHYNVPQCENNTRELFFAQISIFHNSVYKALEENALPLYLNQTCSKATAWYYFHRLIAEYFLSAQHNLEENERKAEQSEFRRNFAVHYCNELKNLPHALLILKTLTEIDYIRRIDFNTYCSLPAFTAAAIAVTECEHDSASCSTNSVVFTRHYRALQNAELEQTIEAYTLFTDGFRYRLSKGYVYNFTVVGCSTRWMFGVESFCLASTEPLFKTRVAIAKWVDAVFSLGEGDLYLHSYYMSLFSCCCINGFLEPTKASCKGQWDYWLKSFHIDTQQFSDNTGTGLRHYRLSEFEEAEYSLTEARDEQLEEDCVARKIVVSMALYSIYTETGRMSAAKKIVQDFPPLEIAEIPSSYYDFYRYVGLPFYEEVGIITSQEHSRLYQKLQPVNCELQSYSNIPFPLYSICEQLQFRYYFEV